MTAPLRSPRIHPLAACLLAFAAAACDRPAADSSDAAPERPGPLLLERLRDPGRVTVRFRAVEQTGGDRVTPLDTGRDGARATLRIPPESDAGLPFRAAEIGLLCAIQPPADALLDVSAPGRELLRVMPLLGRAQDGYVDLGDLALDTAEDVKFAVTAGDEAVLAASVFAVPRGASLPPGSPGPPGAPPFTPDHRSLVGRTDADGVANVRVARDCAGLVVLAPGRPLAFVTRGADGRWPEAVALPAGHPLTIRVETDRVELLPSGTVEVTVDLGGVALTFPAPLNADVPLQLDAPRPATVRAEPRGFQAASVDAGADAESAVLALEPLELAWARLDAAAQDGAEVSITSMKIGRARGTTDERADFVPEHACVGYPTEDGGALAGALHGEHDVIVKAEGYLDELVRGVSFEGSHDAPTTTQIALREATPVAGRLVDAATGKPLQGFVQVRALDGDFADLPRLWHLAGTVGLLETVPSGVDGAFAYATGSPHDLSFEAVAPGYAPARIARVARADTAALEIRLERGHAVAGRVEPADSAVAGARRMAYLVDDAPRVFRTEVAPDGTFRFERIPAGSYRAYVDRDDRALFAGTLGDAATALAERLHAMDRGEPVDIDGAVSDLVLQADAPVEFPAR